LVSSVDEELGTYVLKSGSDLEAAVTKIFSFDELKLMFQVAPVKNVWLIFAYSTQKMI
jgi:hypothetical protein